MKIYTKAGDLAFSTFTFPDGQPHFKLETYDREFDIVTVELSLRSPSDLLLLLLVSSVLRSHGYAEVNLDIRYLLGARMDRAIDNQQPFTLDVVARLINGAGFSRVRILDVHSEVATKLIRNSTNVLPKTVVDGVMATQFWGKSTSIVTPDKGAIPRVEALTAGWCGGSRVQAFKKRDMATGNLGGFELERNSEVLPNCLIIDDICDGGRTFEGLAEELRTDGAKRVDLYITHGIFSKGLPLKGIDRIFTTDSYCPQGPYLSGSNLTVIPISMKEIGG